jgi:PKD repeat protein
LSSGGKKVYRYQISNIGTALEIGTFCHENGHMLCGYPDLYDYTDSSAGVGDWCLMAHGSWGGTPAGSNPSQICAYLKRASGWATTTALTLTNALTATVSAAAGPNFNHFYRLQKPGVTTEYFLAECRYQTGHDADLPGSGVLIWHIDERGDNSKVNLNPNTTHNNYEATVVQADNAWDLEKNQNNGDTEDLYYSGNPSSGYSNLLNDSSAPNAHWWNGAASGVKFSAFSVQATDMTFVVGDLPPVANFSASPTNGAVPLMNVAFADTSTGTITNWSWDFGDGNTLPNTTTANPRHTYLNAGTYSPSLTVIGPGGTSSTNRLDYIVVTNPPPVANFVANQTSGLAPLRVRFANTSSSLVTNASWSFGDGGILNTNASAVTHTYANVGTYSVSLTVIGPGGMSSTNKAD